MGSLLVKAFGSLRMGRLLVLSLMQQGMWMESDARPATLVLLKNALLQRTPSLSLKNVLSPSNKCFGRDGPMGAPIVVNLSRVR